jgi:glycosyltransferase involved in cell wall biosynthesis
MELIGPLWHIFGKVRIKIAQVCSTFPPYQAGMGNVCYHYSKGLAQLGYYVEVFTLKTDTNSINDPEEKFHVTRIRPRLKIGNAGLIPQLVKQLKGFDIIHLHYPFFGGDIFAIFTALRCRIPCIVSYHQDPSADTKLKKIIIWLYRQLFESFVFKNGSKILILSNDHYIHSNLIRYNIPENKIVVVPNGVDCLEIDNPPFIPDVRDEYNIPDASSLAIFVAALDRAHYFKNLDLLLKSITHFQGKFYLMIVGDGDLRTYFENLTQYLKVNNRVIFLGSQNNQNTVAYVRQADFLVLPSFKTESFGIVLLEAMASRKPVIASDIPGVRTVVKDKLTGLLFQNQDLDDLIKKIQTLIDNPNLRKKMGLRGRQEVERRYDWRAIIPALDNVYKSVINLG